MNGVTLSAYQGPESFQPDALVSRLLAVLWTAGIQTRGSCGGHLRRGWWRGPYVSVLHTEGGARWLATVTRWRWLLVLPWTMLESQVDGEIWISLTAPGYSFLWRSRKRYRTAMAWDTWWMVQFCRLASTRATVQRVRKN